MPRHLRVAVVTISTRCSSGQATDESGPFLCDLVLGRNWAVLKTVTVTDDKLAIEDALKQLISNDEIDLILTTGGTGISPDDVTPEATRAVLDRELPGLVSGMFLTSFQETPFAMLSRAVAGVAQKAVICNMPGSVRAVSTCFKAISPVLEHAVSLARGNVEEVSVTHSQLAGDDSSHQHPHRHRLHSHGHHGRHRHQPYLHHQLSWESSGRSESRGSSRNDDSARRHHGEERPRESPYPMVFVEKALEIVLSNCNSLQTEEISLRCCSFEKPNHGSLQNRYVAQDLFSLCPVPAFRASVKDGYAVRSEDGAGQRLVMGRSDAGFCYEGGTLEPGYAIAVNTGAKVPDSADAVVQIEDTKFISGKSLPFGDVKVPILETIELVKAPVPGQDIRPIGSDLQINEKLVSKNDRLLPAVVALLVSGGYSSVPVFKLPSVAVISTGSELVTYSPSQQDGLVRDSNRPMLIELLLSHGFPAVDCGIARDTIEDHRSRLQFALSIPGVRVIVTTGGVSVGDCDFVKDVLVHDFNATIHFGRVFVKPGKPTVFATIKREQETILVFSLPGNPVSALVTAYLFLLPALRQLGGCLGSSLVPTMFAKLEHNFDLDPRPEFHRVTLRSDPTSGTLLASSTGSKQASSRIASATTSGSSPVLMIGLLALPPSSDERKTISAGTILPVHPLIPF